MATADNRVKQQLDYAERNTRVGQPAEIAQPMRLSGRLINANLATLQIRRQTQYGICDLVHKSISTGNTEITI
jgi:hypothetical protein